MSTTLSIGGSGVTIPDAVILGRFVPYSKGSYPTLTLAARGGPLDGLPEPYLGKEAILQIGGTTYFTGDVISGPHCSFSPQFGWVRSYQCAGLRYRLDLFPHTDSNTGTSSSGYNLHREDPSYISGRSGRTLGQILADVLTMDANADAADAAGVGNYASLGPAVLSAQTLADLAPLQTIPPAPTYFSSDRFGTAIQSILSQWAPNIFFWIDPATGDYRFSDLRKFAAQTLTLEDDPVEPPALNRNCAHSFSRVRVRGGPLVRGILLDTAGGGLAEDFGHDGLSNSAAKTAWTASDFQTPTLPPGQATGTCSLSGGGISTSFTITNGGYNNGVSTTVAIAFTGGGGTGAAAHGNTNGSGVVTSVTRTAAGSGYTTAPTMVFAAPGGSNTDTGTCTCPSTTTVTVTSANTGQAWGSNYWDQTGSGRHGVVYLTYSAGAGITQYTTRRIISNTSLTAAGTSTLTLDEPLAITSYDAYEIVGLSGGASVVWRQYSISNSDIADALANQFSYPQPFRLAADNGAMLTSFPIGSVVSSSGSEVTAWFTSDATAGTILFTQPTYTLAGSTTPSNVRALVAVNQGPQAAVWPPDAYAPATLTADAVTGHGTIVPGSGFGSSASTVYVIGDGSGATATATITGGAVSAISITAGGSDYTWAVIAVFDPTGSADVQYGGTSNTVEGLERTFTATIGAWRDPGNYASMLAYAYDLFQSVCDTVVEGSVRYLGLFTDALTPGLALNVTGATYSTGWEDPLTSFAGYGGLAVTSVEVEWPMGGGTHQVTTMHTGNHRAQCGQTTFLKPNQRGLSITGGFQGGFSGLAGGIGGPAVGSAAALAGGIGGGIGGFMPSTGGLTSDPSKLIADPSKLISGLPGGLTPGDLA